jgi:hypothetical protein
MSNETTFTRRAGAALLARVYAQPTTQSRRVGRLRFLTEDGFPEVCVLLAERADGAGISWVQLRLPQPPNNVKGGVRRSALGPFHVVHMRLVVNRSALRITLFKRGGGDSAHASAWARPARRRRPATSVSARIPCQRQHAVRRTGDGHGGVIGIQGDRSARTDPLRIALDPPDGELRTGAVAPRHHDPVSGPSARGAARVASVIRTRAHRHAADDEDRECRHESNGRRCDRRCVSARSRAIASNRLTNRR